LKNQWIVALRRTNALIRRAGCTRGIFWVFKRVVGAGKRQADATKTTFQENKLVKIAPKTEIWP